jgi:hypothetical protein
MNQPVTKELIDAIVAGDIVPLKAPLTGGLEELSSLLGTEVPGELFDILSAANGFRCGSVIVYDGPAVTTPRDRWDTCELVATTRQYRRMLARVKQPDGSSFWPQQTINEAIVIAEDEVGCPFLWFRRDVTSDPSVIRLDRDTLQECELVDTTIAGFVRAILRGAIQS